MWARKRWQKHSLTGGFRAAALGLYIAWQFQITDRNIQEKLLVNNPFCFVFVFVFFLFFPALQLWNIAAGVSKSGAGPGRFTSS